MTATGLPNGDLEISVTREEQVELQEQRRDNPDEFGTERAERDWLEPLVTNDEYEWIEPEWIGALTSAPILGLLGEARPLRDGETRADFPALLWAGGGMVCDVEKAYAYMSYAVRSLLDDLADDGRCVFQNGEVTE